jgi:nicotinamidase-related amidase
MTYRIKVEDTAASVVDIQGKLLPLISQNELLVNNVIILIKGLKIHQIPLIVTQQYTKGLGGTDAEIKSAIGEYEHIEKLSFSCCGEPAFMTKLKEINKKYIILMGIETHVCVLQTALDLLSHNYIPVVIEDCVSSRNLNDKNIAIERMRSSGAVISTKESILFELTEVSGTDKFKAISKLIK